MRQLLPTFLLFILTVILCGCPYESPYNLDDEPQENVDESLIGHWSALVSKPGNEKNTRSEPVKLTIQKRTDKEYDIAITGSISELKPYHVIRNDSIRGTAYTSTLMGKRFLNSFIGGRVYIAELITDTACISIFPLAEYFTSKYIKSSRELRKAVEFHYRVRLQPGYDHSFSLKQLQKLN